MSAKETTALCLSLAGKIAPNKIVVEGCERRRSNCLKGSKCNRSEPLELVECVVDPRCTASIQDNANYMSRTIQALRLAGMRKAKLFVLELS